MKPKRNLLPEDRVDLTPMIDIVFLLLIYFMVTTTIIKQEADLSLILPSAVAATPDTPLPEQHLIDILEDGSVMLNGMAMDGPTDRNLPNLTERLRMLKAASDRAGLRTVVVVQPDEEALQQSITNVLNALRAADIRAVSFGR